MFSSFSTQSLVWHQKIQMNPCKNRLISDFQRKQQILHTTKIWGSVPETEEPPVLHIHSIKPIILLWCLFCCFSDPLPWCVWLLPCSGSRVTGVSVKDPGSLSAPSGSDFYCIVYNYEHLSRSVRRCDPTIKCQSLLFGSVAVKRSSDELFIQCSFFF